MLSAIGRAAIRRITTGSSNRVLWQSGRVVVDRQVSQSGSTTIPRTFISLHRCYATATNAAAKSTASAASTTKKPTTVKKSAKTTTNAAKKPKKKVAKKALKSSKKKVAKPKQRGKNPLTEKGKARAKKAKEISKLAELRATALLGEPAKGTVSSWAQWIGESAKGSSGQGHFAIKNEGFKNLDAEKLESLNHRANERSAANLAAYRKYVESHTPDEIRLANLARSALNRHKKATAKSAGKKPTLIRQLEDTRKVKRPSTSFAIYTADRFATGELKGISLIEATRLNGRHWRELSPSEKKPYEDKAASEMLRYVQEYRTVYGHDIASNKIKAPVAAKA